MSNYMSVSISFASGRFMYTLCLNSPLSESCRLDEGLAFCLMTSNLHNLPSAVKLKYLIDYRDSVL